MQLLQKQLNTCLTFNFNNYQSMQLLQKQLKQDEL